MPGRSAAVARELTKVHQEVVRGVIENLAEEMEQRELKGEVVLVIGPPPDERPRHDEKELLARVDALVAEGASRSDAIREVASECGVARKDLYRIVHGRED